MTPPPTPKNKAYAKKKYFSINLIHKAGHILPLPISVTASIFLVSAFIFLTLTPIPPVH